MISPNSRYKNSSLTTIEKNGKNLIYILPQEPEVTVFQYSYYTVSFADRIDTIAYTYLGNPALWYMIARVNPQIINFMDLQPGTVIRIPTIATVQ